MYQKLKHLYFFTFILVTGVVLFIIFFMQNNQYDIQGNSPLSTIESYSLYDSKGNTLGLSSDSDLNIEPDTEVFYSYEVPTDIDNDFGIGFSTSHMDLEVFCDDTVIYSFTCSHTNLFGHTPGYGYHIIRHLDKYAGKNLSFKVSSHYPVKNDSFSYFYIGNYLDIYRSMISVNFWAVVIAVLTFVVGAIITLYWFISLRKVGTTSPLGYLGLFSIIVSIWCVNESPMIVFMNNNQVFSAYISFITLMLLPIPFILFIKGLYVQQEYFIWPALLGLSNINILICILLQVFNIADFKQTICFTHIVLVVVILSIIIFTMYDYSKNKGNKGNKGLHLHMVCIFFIAVCLAIDMIFYYTKDSIQNLYISNIGFLVYIIINGASEINKTSKLAAQGKKSELYKEMAYKDGLTHLLNRTAMNTYIEEADVSSHSYIVVMLDLNNLKLCNDTFGHEEGDLFIQTSARLIECSFGDIGSCYRIGGDEFCIIIKDCSEDICKSHINALTHMIDATNKSNKLNVNISIAYGYASYDNLLDKDLKETRARADSLMYTCKFKMKMNML